MPILHESVIRPSKEHVMNKEKCNCYDLNLTLLLLCLALILQALPARSAAFCPRTPQLPGTEQTLAPTPA